MRVSLISSSKWLGHVDFHLYSLAYQKQTYVLTFVKFMFDIVLQAFYSKKASHTKSQDGGLTQNLDTMLINTKHQEFEAAEIFSKVRDVSRERKFEESFELIVKLNVDPTQGD